MQQKIGLASIITLIAMLLALAVWDGGAPAASETAAFNSVIGQNSAVSAR